MNGHLPGSPAAESWPDQTLVLGGRQSPVGKNKTSSRHVQAAGEEYRHKRFTLSWRPDWAE